MKRFLVFLYFFLFFSSVLFSQKENYVIPDSLQGKTNTELKSLISVARYKNLNSAIIYTETLHKKALEQGNKMDLIESYFYFGHIAFLQGKYTNSIALINQGIDIAETKQDSILRKLYAVRGNTYEAYGDYQKAYDDYEMMLRIAKKFNDQRGIFIAETSFAKLKLNNKQYLEALNVYKHYYENFKNTSVMHNYSKVSMLISISDVYLQMKALDSARVYIDLGFKESKKIEDYDSLCYFHTYDGIYEYYKGNISEALLDFEKAEERVSDIQTEQKLNIEVFYYMAQCYFELKEYQTAINTIQKAFTIINRENIQNSAISTKIDYVPYEYLYFLKLLARCYENIGDEKNQDFYWNQYSQKKIESEKKVFPINKQIYNLLNEEEEKAFIERQSQRKDAAEKQIPYLYAILAFVCIMGIVGYFIYRKKNQQKKFVYAALIEKVSALEAKNKEDVTKNELATKKIVNIPDEKAKEILKRLQKFEAQELYLDVACNLHFVAKKVKTNVTYLSKIINEHKEASFNEYINNLRIQYTLTRLKSDPVFRAYSIKSISEEVGYKSADSFTKHFKKHTSLYPSYYIKKLNQQHT